MKYLLLTLEYPPFKGGVGNYYFNLVKYWPKEINPTLTLPFVRGGKLKVIDNSKRELVDETRSFLKWWPAIKTLQGELKKGEENYVLVGHLLPLGTVAWLLSFVYKFKYCVFLHGYDFNSAMAQPRKRWLAKAILNKADKIICANTYTLSQVNKILDPGLRRDDKGGERVALVNPGIEGETVVYNEGKIEALRNRYNLSGKTVLLTVGRLVKRKGVDMVLEALNLIKNGAPCPAKPNPATSAQTDRNEPFLTKFKPNSQGEVGPELTYVVIGQGEEEANLRAKIADLGQSGQVQILTDIDDEAKMNWYKLADIFIMTARQIGADMEGFGIVYLEAGLAGKPVIAGKSGGVADAVADNVNGLLVDGTNPEAIAEAIVKLAKYEKLRQRLGDEGRRRALTMFSWKKQAEKIYQHLNN